MTPNPKSRIVFIFLLTFSMSACVSSNSEKNKDRVAETKGQIIGEYLKTIQKSADGKHLFGHESTIMMGVSGPVDWEVKSADEIGTDIATQKSDVNDLTGQQPAIMGYDAFKLILDVSDNVSRKAEVEASIKGLKLYVDNGGLIAFNWHMQPIKLPTYRERAYRMDEFQNNPYIELMKKEKPFYRIANGFETRDEWWMEYESKRLAPMAERLKIISDDGSGIIFRPFHEADGAWFWWGLDWLQGNQALNGKDALMKVFIETARYFKQKLPGILIAFSTDKLDYVNHDNATDSKEIAVRYRDEFLTFLPEDSKDLELIDIYGMDLYINSDNPGRYEDFRIKLQGLTLIANQHDKICAITEAGNRGLPPEEDDRQPCINWYTKYLFQWISDPKIDVAFNVIWQNWSNNRNPAQTDPADGYFVPVYQNSKPGKDFVKYIQLEQTLMLNDFNKAIKQLCRKKSVSCISCGDYKVVTLKKRRLR